MNVLDLFSGIGGFSLGLERAGMRTVAFCEVEPYCRAILAKHWPSVPCYPDVRDLTADRLKADGISVDLICGGFPCQDISTAGTRAGIEGKRSGLWSEYARLIGELRPHYVIVENVSALLGRGLDRVLGDLAALRFDAEWHCIRAADVGAPHLRDRIWIVAYPQHPDANGQRSYRKALHEHRGAELRNEQIGLPRPLGETLAYAIGVRKLQQEGLEQDEWRWLGDCGGWRAEPDVGRVAYGIPARVDRIKCLGNSVVPQIPEIIGRAIMKANENA